MHTEACCLDRGSPSTAAGAGGVDFSHPSLASILLESCGMTVVLTQQQQQEQPYSAAVMAGSLVPEC